MMRNRPLDLRFLLVPVAMVTLSASARAQTETLTLWPGEPPLEMGEFGEEGEPPANSKAKLQIKRLTNVTEPRITLYPAPADRNSGAAVLVAPGGGYNILAIEHEGTMVTEWLNEIGVNAVLLTYRVPRRESETQKVFEAPLADAQRALRLVRKMAGQWGIDPDRLGMLGFSAGGHLTLATGTNAGKKSYEPVDDADQLSCRPDFLIPVYPAYLVEKGDGGALPEEIRIGKDAPPVFLAHANDDPHSAEGSARVYLALKQAEIPCELHIYAKGGHGFGMLKDAGPASSWPQRCEEWMRSLEILKGP